MAVHLDGSSYFSSLQEQIKSEDVYASFVREYHITLKFLGEVSVKDLEWVKEQLGKIKFKSFAIQFNHLEMFMDAGVPRVVYIGCEKNPALNELADQVEKALSSRFPTEKRGFVAHMTLCRVKQVKGDAASYVSKVKSVKIVPHEFTINNFCLVRSELSPSGAKYTDIAVFTPD